MSSGQCELQPLPPHRLGEKLGAWGGGHLGLPGIQALETQGPLLGTPSHGILGRGLKAQRATEWQEANPEAPETQQFFNS